jgi:sec-independent protein translocase protein TatB
MFGLSSAELLVVGLVAILVLGPDKLPGAARAAGRFYVYLSRMLTEARAVLKTEIYLANLDQPPTKRRTPAPPALDSGEPAPAEKPVPPTAAASAEPGNESPSPDPYKF